MHNTQIIILAGGKGKRMGGDFPKVMTMFGEKPIIDSSIEAVEKLSLSNKPIVVVGFGAEKVKEHLGERAVYAFQEEQLGTGHAVLCARDVIGEDVRDVLVLYGDHPNTKSETIEQILSSHSKVSPIITMATLKVPNFEGFYSGFNGFGRIVRDEAGNIERVVELKDADEDEKQIKELNPSLFCFNSKWLWENLPKVKNENAQGEYYLPDLVGFAIKQGEKISSVEINPLECIGVNTPEELERAKKVLGAA